MEEFSTIRKHGLWQGKNYIFKKTGNEATNKSLTVGVNNFKKIDGVFIRKDYAGKQ